MAIFPGALVTAAGNFTDVIGTTWRSVSATLSARLNSIRDEIIAIQTNIGVNAHIDPSGNNLGSVDGRLDVIDGGWTSWTPALAGSTTAPVLSNNASHVAWGRYKQVGKKVTVLGGVKWGNAGNTSGSGTISCSLPVPASAAGITAGLPSVRVGSYRLNDATYGAYAGASVQGSVELISGSAIGFWVPGSDAITLELLTDSNPIPLGGIGDYLLFDFEYEAA